MGKLSTPKQPGSKPERQTLTIERAGPAPAPHFLETFEYGTPKFILDLDPVDSIDEIPQNVPRETLPEVSETREFWLLPPPVQDAARYAVYQAQSRGKVVVLEPIRVGNDIYRISVKKGPRSVVIRGSYNEAILHTARARFRTLLDMYSTEKAKLTGGNVGVMRENRILGPGLEIRERKIQENLSQIKAKASDLESQLAEAQAAIDELSKQPSHLEVSFSEVLQDADL